MVDLVGPNKFTYPTVETGTEGEVLEASTFFGTSAATPVVSGMAALVKEWYVDVGLTWIDSPGRLHTFMLAMGDRRYSTDPDNTSVATSKRTVGSDDLYGLGHVRLRFLSSQGNLLPAGNHMWTKSFTSSSGPYSYFPFGQAGLPNGAAMVKCVTMQDEDMSSKNDISDMDLEIRLYVAGQYGPCTTLAARVTDDGYDTKSMVAYDAVVPGKCLQVVLTPVHVTSSGITTHTMCYYAAETEDE